ncbi:MAG: hypothetical protein MK180_03025 [Rhodobacteraceae bacterium]|nr:hypothetical protein [Paracoccaceae bacterium]
MRSLALAALIAIPTIASAESDVERMERLASTMSTKMYAYIEERFPAAKGNLPDPGWNDEIRAAADCTMGAWEAEIGAAQVTALLDEMENHLNQEIEDFQAWSEGMPVSNPLSDEQNVAIEAQCGMANAMMNKMMSDPNMPNLMQAMSAAMGDG